MKKREQGFTLTELMIVVAIIGVISSFAIPAYNDYLYTARLQVIDDHLQQLRIFQEAYKLNNSTYLAGTMNASTMATSPLATDLGFKPGPEGEQFLYTVNACASGPITDCYYIKVEWAENPTNNFLELTVGN